MEPRIVFHVMPAEDGWQLTKEGRKSRIGTFHSRDEAIRRAQVEGRKSAHAVLVLHGADYAVEQELPIEAVTTG